MWFANELPDVGKWALVHVGVGPTIFSLYCWDGGGWPPPMGWFYVLVFHDADTAVAEANNWSMQVFFFGRGGGGSWDSCVQRSRESVGPCVRPSVRSSVRRPTNHLSVCRSVRLLVRPSLDPGTDWRKNTNSRAGGRTFLR